MNNVIMKKFIWFIMCLFILENLLLSQDYYGARVVVNVVDKTTTERGYLETLVSQKLSANLYEYAHFNILDVDNAPEMRKILRDAEKSGEYNESSIAEAGKKLFAEYIINAEILKDNSKYNLVCKFVTLDTFEESSVTVTGKNNTEELYAGTGCAGDEITIKLCDQIGITLSNTQINILRHGEAELSDDELKKKFEEDEAEWQKRLNNIDEQIERLKNSTNLSAVEEMSRLEADRARAEDKLRITQLREQQRKEAETKKRKDEEEDKKRSAKMIKERDNMSEEAKKKASEYRKKELEASTLAMQINVIEAKKKVFVEIREEIEREISESNASLQQELEKELEKIDKREYRGAEIANGEPTPQALKNRQGEKDDKEEEYKKLMKAAAGQIRNSIKKQLDELLNEIRSDYKAISQKRALSTLRNDLKYSIDEYDGEDCKWDVTLYIYSDGAALAEQKFALKYKDVTGLPPAKFGAKNFEEYDYNVQLYDSFFKRGDDVLTFEVVCNAVARADDLPSQYDFNFLEIRVRDTASGKVLASSISPSLKSVEHKRTVPYDIRTLEVQRIEKEKIVAELEKEREQQEKERRKKEQEKQKQEEKQRVRDARSEYWAICRNEYLGNNFLLNVVGGFLLNTEGFSGFDAGLRFNWPNKNLFWALDIGNSKKTELNASDSYGFAFSFGIGGNIYFPILKYPPSILIIGQFGPDFSIDEDQPSFFRLSLGFEVPLSYHFTIYEQCTIRLGIHKPVFRFKTGISLRFLELVR